VTNADHLLSPLLCDAGFRHAFFTRRGGVSSGAYTSLNFSIAVGDSELNVAKNLERAAEVLGVDVDRIYFLSQVHGCDIEIVTGDENRREVLARRGDVVLSNASLVACAVRSADCVPVLLADVVSGSVAAVHAGWRGVAAGVVRAAAVRLAAAAGIGARMVAAIGPHISVSAFEVGDEVALELERCSAVNHVVVRRDGARPHVDLRRIVRGQLEAVGVLPGDIDDVVGCTVGEPDLFFSFRRDGPHSGRHLSAIVPRRR
jgi:YfiH family protein